jgi:membrane-associated protease RseP (regulator of RpoE activity)
VYFRIVVVVVVVVVKCFTKRISSKVEMNVKLTSTVAVAIPGEFVDGDLHAVGISDDMDLESSGVLPVASSTRIVTLRAEDDSFPMHSEYMTISIFKLRPRSYTGISFTEDENKVVRVEQISESSPFQTTPLRCGDAVVSVNQFEATSANLVGRLFKTLDFWVTLVIHRTGGASNFVTTILRKHVPHQRLGVHFVASPNWPVVIANLDTGGVLAHTSLLQVGDMVHTINGRAVNTVEVAMEVLNSNPDRVEMVTASPQGLVLVFRSAPLLASWWCACLCAVLSLIVVMVLVFFFVVARHK